MRVALTGTPGTGKTTAAEALADSFDVVHLNDVVREEGFWTERDVDRDSLVVDLDALGRWLDERNAEVAAHTESGDARTVGDDAEHDGDERTVVVESHLAHRFDADRVVVLRCHPEQLLDRLRGRADDAEAEHAGGDDEGGRSDPKSAAGSGTSPAAVERSAAENAESEALDVILSEAVERHGAANVYEVDTTDRTPAEVAEAVREAVEGHREPSAGTVDFTGFL